MTKNSLYDVIIIGAGAAGLMAAICAGKRGKKTLLIEHTTKIGEKIRISGGGRCNFTNLHASSNNYICQNPHFVKSALAGYTQHDFIKLVESYHIAYHEKTLGQLFCDGSSKQIINMMLNECQQYDVDIKLNCNVIDISKTEQFEIASNEGVFTSDSLIIASGGLSIPQMGASDFGYRIAKKFGLKIIPPRPALVPLIVADSMRDMFTQLSGISNLSVAWYKKTSFKENILFTHKGLSGPAILQISSYLEKFHGEEISINLLPELDLKQQFMADKNHKQTVANYLKTYLTNRLIDHLAGNPDFNKSLTDLKKESLFAIADQLHNFKVPISGTEGYKKAEVTAGGIDTNEFSSKTMASKKVPGLFFIGEVVDVTGWLGGYNFQWAWSSGFAAGNNC
ncbi:NAD(P)/FAD-dependent oxidoreductase [Candidatus Paracaedibacter symbiosus]|uniref:NAD(P)/FAD-dependent oxidoreductase n=1 Tax=Candidatus Paracaedibacter symbiosus TaxID=244582 RepID=UPI000509C9C2|nr:NAD(P)/FAD-dependent oxidoreductase [Candidatus Paracaedibacter symbiosus]